MARRVVLVIMDGAGFDAARSECGYLEGAVALGHARRWKMQAATPSLSGPLYETIHTGLWPHEHGVMSNEAMHLSTSPNIFSIARAAGRTTAAVAQAFFHHLYVDRPWDQLRSIEHHDEATDIQHGRFYSMEGYGRINAVAPAEIDLCGQLTCLIERHAPDYALLHTCSADTLGHTFGGDSAEYRRQIWHIDNALSRAVPVWRAADYDVIATADHGMTADGWHGGTDRMAVDIPFYYFGSAPAPEPEEILHQTGVAGFVLGLMDLPTEALKRRGFEPHCASSSG